ncbi:hypothetical protein [Mucilaginibacter sp.]|uniref:hypothetical protein n=1 Tax=Mucilaginibacter sp. TaxID=1882438 RepID=UPI0035BC4DE0
MNRLFTLTTQYYRTLWLYNVSFTLCFFVLSGFGMGFNAVSLFYCKVFGFCGAALLHYYSASNTYFYYRNAGMQVRRLFLYALLMDVLASLLLIIPLNLILHAAASIKG